MSREPESVVFEATYWQEVLSELQNGSEHLGAVLETLMAVATTNAEAGIDAAFLTVDAGSVIGRDGRTPALANVLNGIERNGKLLLESLEHFGKLQAALAAIGDLAGGRAKAIVSEGLEGQT